MRCDPARLLELHCSVDRGQTRLSPPQQCLMYIQLPFMEDLRQFSFPSLENNKKKFTPTGAVFLQ